MGGECVEALEDASVRIREQVAVQVEGDADRGVAHLRVEVLRVGSGGDHECGVGVAEVMEAQADQPGATDGGAEEAVAEVVLVQHLAARRRENEAAIVRLAREQLPAEHMRGGDREVDDRRQEARTARRRPARPGRTPRLEPELVARIRSEHAHGRTLGEIARQLNAEGVQTAQGGPLWWPSTVRAVLARSSPPRSAQTGKTRIAG
jgi:hypothetical protein